MEKNAKFFVTKSRVFGQVQRKLCNSSDDSEEKKKPCSMKEFHSEMEMENICPAHAETHPQGQEATVFGFFIGKVVRVLHLFSVGALGFFCLTMYQQAETDIY